MKTFFFCRNQVKWNNRRPCFCGISGGDQVIWAEAQSVLILFILLYTKWIFNPIQTGGGGRLTPHRLKSFITHERLRLQCSYLVNFPQIYLGTIWCC